MVAVKQKIKPISLGEPLVNRATAAKYVALQSRDYPNNEYKIVKKGDYYYAAYMGKKDKKNPNTATRTYGNIVKKQKRVPIYAGMQFAQGGKHGYGKTKKIGYKIIETTYDVNPDFPDDMAIISEREVKRVLNGTPTRTDTTTRTVKRNGIVKITKAYIRHYADNGQTTAYVEWIDNKGKTGLTEGKPSGLHMKALLDRARREGVTVQTETWNGTAKRNATAAKNPSSTLKDEGFTFVSLKGKELRVKDADNKNIEIYYQVPSGGSSSWTLTYKGKQYEFVSSEPLKRNATAADFKQHQKSRLQDLAAMFQGKANGEKRRVLESDYAPKDKYRLGYLVQIKIKDGGKTIPIDFDGESYLAGDLRNNLWVVGKDAKITNIKLPPKGQLKYLGELIQVDYVTAKKHIEGGKTVRFYHKLGEVTKETPNLFIDDEGFPIIVSGGYDVWDVGIVN